MHKNVIEHSEDSRQPQMTKKKTRDCDRIYQLAAKEHDNKMAILKMQAEHAMNIYNQEMATIQIKQKNAQLKQEILKIKLDKLKRLYK